MHVVGPPDSSVVSVSTIMLLYLKCQTGDLFLTAPKAETSRIKTLAGQRPVYGSCVTVLDSSVTLIIFSHEEQDRNAPQVSVSRTLVFSEDFSHLLSSISPSTIVLGVGVGG